MQNLRLKAKIIKKFKCYTSFKFMIMQKSNQVFKNKNNLYFHTQSQVKREQNTSVKELGHVESKMRDFDKLNFHVKCKVKMKKSMKSYGHSKPKM